MKPLERHDDQLLSMKVKVKVKLKSLSRVQLFATPWTVAYQAPLSISFSSLPFPSPEDLPDPEIEPRSPASQADSLPSEPPGNPSYTVYTYLNQLFFKQNC